LRTPAVSSCVRLTAARQQLPLEHERPSVTSSAAAALPLALSCRAPGGVGDEDIGSRLCRTADASETWR
jgi:hypothetical protein